MNRGTANTSGNAGMEIDIEDRMKERDEEITKLFLILDIIWGKINEDARLRAEAEVLENKIDIDTSDELSGALITVFTCLRKEQGDDAGSAKYRAYNTNVLGSEINIGTIVDAVKAAGISLNFMVATPIVEIMTLFKSFFDEVRTGVTRFKVRSNFAKGTAKRDSSGRVIQQTEQKGRTQNIAQFGLTNHHVPLLQGITLAPERRTGVVRSLGPMAQAIILLMENTYHGKIAAALENSLQMLPMGVEIVNLLKISQHPGQVSGVLKELGDILLLTTARSTQKFYFPLTLLSVMWRNRGTVKWSFSGAPMMKIFTSFIAERNVKFIMRSGSNPLLLSECVFHAMFGTYLDDLKVLSTITTKSSVWSVRREVNSVFTDRAKKPKVEFTPITFKFVSKMAQSLMTKTLGNVDPTAMSRPSFAGFRRRVFTQEFLTYLTTGKSVHSFSSDPAQLQYALKKLKDQLSEDINKEKMLAAGTKKWETFVGVWSPVDLDVVEGTIKFFGSGV